MSKTNPYLKKRVRKIAKFGHVSRTCPRHGHVILKGTPTVPYSGKGKSLKGSSGKNTMVILPL